MSWKSVTLGLLLACFGTVGTGQAVFGQGSGNFLKTFQASLVYIETAEYGYDQLRPWRRKDLVENRFYGVVVSDHQVLTTAYGVTDAASINVRRYDHNALLPATIHTVDYDSNLCLLDLDRSTLGGSLKPVRFREEFSEGEEVAFYWLSTQGRLYSGRGYADHVRVMRSMLSHAKFLHYVVSNTSRRTSDGQLYCHGAEAIGLACWSSENNECGLIPAGVINRFLADAADGDYEGFAAAGFTVAPLLDPTRRRVLHLPAGEQAGVYVKDVYTLGTGSEELQTQDVILAIDGQRLNAYGQYEHRQFKRIGFDHLITGKPVGESIVFDIWRQGQAQRLEVVAQPIAAASMLIPFYAFDRQPEYIVTGGFLLQKLTRPYLTGWGDDWQGIVPPNLFQYYQNVSFKPTPERQDIVLLSYVLPTEENQGYQQLRRLVVKSFNGMEIASIGDIQAAQRLNPDDAFDVIEFENDQPTLVIDRAGRGQTDALVRQRYGVEPLVHIEP